jgi:hypothetical protein
VLDLQSIISTIGDTNYPVNTIELILKKIKVCNQCLYSLNDRYMRLKNGDVDIDVCLEDEDEEEILMV